VLVDVKTYAEVFTYIAKDRKGLSAKLSCLCFKSG
jgi:hypothetical protein